MDRSYKDNHTAMFLGGGILGSLSLIGSDSLWREIYDVEKTLNSLEKMSNDIKKVDYKSMVREIEENIENAKKHINLINFSKKKLNLLQVENVRLRFDVWSCG